MDYLLYDPFFHNVLKVMLIWTIGVLGVAYYAQKTRGRD